MFISRWLTWIGRWDFIAAFWALSSNNAWGAAQLLLLPVDIINHIGLNTWESAGGQPPARGTTGLFHLAILYPTRRDLADALRRVLDAGLRLDGASNHGVSHALYLRDPDQNGVELYWDLPESEWPRSENGDLVMGTYRLDLDALLGELG